MAQSGFIVICGISRPELTLPTEDIFEQLGRNTGVLSDLNDLAVELVLPGVELFAGGF